MHSRTILGACTSSAPASKKSTCCRTTRTITSGNQKVCIVATRIKCRTKSYPDITFKPHVETGVLKVIDEQTWSVIDTHVLDPQEVILCIKTLNLEISETTHERKELIAVGTSTVHGEDLATKGCIRIFEVITVVPEPDRPETNRRLRLIVKDEVKGAVSAVSELGTQGFLIMAQGQKCMVRGLKEDGTLLPVAFMDMQCYVTFLKTLPRTGMLMMGDAFKGLWFTGYTVSISPFSRPHISLPYQQLTTFPGRTLQNDALRALEKPSRSPIRRLPPARQNPLPRRRRRRHEPPSPSLRPRQYVPSPNHRTKKHKLTYKPPTDPKSLSGIRLLPRSTFHTGHFPSTTHLLTSNLTIPEAPSSTFDSAPSDDDAPPQTTTHQLLHTTHSGTLALLTPLSESTYRRLASLTTYLANTLDSPCGLNPKAWRMAGDSIGEGGKGGGVLDGNLIMRWGELGYSRQREGLGKVGGEGEEWVFWGEREVLGGWGIFGRRG